MPNKIHIFIFQAKIEIPEEEEFFNIIESETSSVIDESDYKSESILDHQHIPMTELSVCDPISPLYGKTLLDYKQKFPDSILFDSTEPKWVSKLNIDPKVKKGQNVNLTKVSAVTLRIDEGDVTTIKDALPDIDDHVTDDVIESPSKVTYQTTMISSNQKPSYTTWANQLADKRNESEDFNGNLYPNIFGASVDNRIPGMNTKKNPSTACSSTRKTTCQMMRYVLL